MVSEKRQSAGEGPGGGAVVVVVVLMLLVVPIVALIGVGGLVFVGVRSRAISTTPAATSTAVAAQPSPPATEVPLVVDRNGVILLEGAEVTMDELPAKVAELRSNASGEVHVSVAANPYSPPDVMQQVFNKLSETGVPYLVRPPTPDEVEGAAKADDAPGDGEQFAEPDNGQKEPTASEQDDAPGAATSEASP